MYFNYAILIINKIKFLIKSHAELKSNPIV